jgi:hypothetical protein
LEYFNLPKKQKKKESQHFLSKKKASAPLSPLLLFYTASPLDKLIDASDALSAADAGGDHADVQTLGNILKKIWRIRKLVVILRCI